MTANEPWEHIMHQESFGVKPASLWQKYTESTLGLPEFPYRQCSGNSDMNQECWSNWHFDRELKAPTINDWWYHNKNICDIFHAVHLRLECFTTLWRRQNVRHFADDTFELIPSNWFLHEKYRILILKFHRNEFPRVRLLHSASLVTVIKIAGIWVSGIDFDELTDICHLREISWITHRHWGQAEANIGDISKLILLCAHCWTFIKISLKLFQWVLLTISLHRFR